MRFKEYGQKKNPAVVLIHPEFTRWDFFKKVIPVLAENYFVIVPVLPGYDEEKAEVCFCQRGENGVGRGKVDCIR